MWKLARLPPRHNTDTHIHITQEPIVHSKDTSSIRQQTLADKLRRALSSYEEISLLQKNKKTKANCLCECLCSKQLEGGRQTNKRVDRTESTYAVTEEAEHVQHDKGSSPSGGRRNGEDGWFFLKVVPAVNGLRH